MTMNLAQETATMNATNATNTATDKIPSKDPCN